METDTERLKALRDKMTTQQRKDMADIIATELKRRESLKQKKPEVSSAGTPEVMKDVYDDIGDKVMQLRKDKINERLAKLKQDATPRPRFQLRMPKLGLAHAIGGIVVVCAAFKIALAVSHFQSAPGAPVAPPSENTDGETHTVQPRARLADRFSETERQVLTELDARRAELARREEGLDRRDAEIKEQGRLVAAKLQELKTVTESLERKRKDQEQERELRFEQLAQVYGSMAPNEAAVLVSKLDENTAVGLLERMPGKRMGQILSLMEKDKAVQYTKLLSGRAPVPERRNPEM